MKNYIRREIKFILYMVIIFAIVLVLVPILTGQKAAYSLEELFQNRRMMMFIVLLLAYALVYPVITYTSIKRHLNGTFNDNRKIFDKAFTTLEYIKTVDTPDKIVYRKKSKVTRFAQWWEDGVEILPAENPVIISGLRKSVTRVDRIIDQLLLQEKNQDA